MADNYELWINGKWTRSKGSDSIEVVNPAVEKAFATVPDGTRDDFTAAIEAAKTAFYRGPWGHSTPSERASIIWRLADLIEESLVGLAEIETENTGKPLENVSKAVDIHDSVDNLRFYATLARDTHGIAAGKYVNGMTHMFRHEPVGVVGQITPWNYPFQMAAWKVGPALAAGCTIVLKPASNTPLTSLLLGELASRAGLPEGVLNIVTGRGAKAEVLATHEDVRMVSLTGSTSTGQRLAKLAAGTMKRTHMELGGKAPFIVFADADIRRAAETAVLGSTFNTGQDCTAAARVYVEESRYEEMRDALVGFAERVKVGDPLSADTAMGPLISGKQLQRVSGFVTRAVSDGARIETGGRRPDSLSVGYYYSPTIITGAAQSSEIIQEEVFGPVLTLNTFRSEDEAVKLANDVVYGLAGSVWSSDISRAMRVSHLLEFGTVWINNHLIVASEAPHGGFKMSGFGKELSLEAVSEYRITKNIAITTEQPPADRI